VHRGWIVGRCCRCEQGDVAVLWLGRIHTDHDGAAPFYACDPCIRRLEEMTRAYQQERTDGH
jgi:hypothetical protein